MRLNVYMARFFSFFVMSFATDPQRNLETTVTRFSAICTRRVNATFLAEIWVDDRNFESDPLKLLVWVFRRYAHFFFFETCFSGSSPGAPARLGKSKEINSPIWVKTVCSVQWLHNYFRLLLYNKTLQIYTSYMDTSVACIASVLIGEVKRTYTKYRSYFSKRIEWKYHVKSTWHMNSNHIS